MINKTKSILRNHPNSIILIKIIYFLGRLKDYIVDGISVGLSLITDKLMKHKKEGILIELTLKNNGKTTSGFSNNSYF